MSAAVADEAKRLAQQLFDRNSDLNSDEWAFYLAGPVGAFEHAWERLLPAKMVFYDMSRHARRAGTKKPVAWFNWPHFLDLFGAGSLLPLGKVVEASEVEDRCGDAFRAFLVTACVDYDKKDVVLVQTVAASTAFAAVVFDGKEVRQAGKENIRKLAVSAAQSTSEGRTADAKATAPPTLLGRPLPPGAQVQTRISLVDTALDCGPYLRGCYNCSTTEKTPKQFRLCGRCRVACYCSTDCQRAHWLQHKPICAPVTATAKTAEPVARSSS